MPSAAALAKAASVAAPVARRAAQSEWTPVIVGVGLLLLLRGIGDLGRLFNAPVELAAELAQGTGDFFEGAFTGATRTEIPINTARVAELPDTLFILSAPTNDAPTFVLGTPSSFDPNAPTSVVVDMVDGEPVLTVTNPSAAVPLPAFTAFGPDVSLAQEVGAAVFFDPLTGFFEDPILDLGGTIIIPSIEDTAAGFIDTPIIGFRGEGIGPSLGDVGSFFRRLF